jgi:hypothetical protein
MNWWSRLRSYVWVKWVVWRTLRKYKARPVPPQDRLRMSPVFGKISANDDAEDHLEYWPEIRE